MPKRLELCRSELENGTSSIPVDCQGVILKIDPNGAEDYTLVTGDPDTLKIRILITNQDRVSKMTPPTDRAERTG